MTKTTTLSDIPLIREAEQKRTLLRLTLELTKRCNNNCIHCYNNLPANDKSAMEKELSTAYIKDLIDQAVDLGLLWILLTGGEIFLRSDFFDLYRHIIKKGVLVSIFSNASLITPDHIHLFKKYPPRDIEISVYGVTKSSYAKVSRTNTFLKVMDGIRRLQEASIPFTLKSTVMKANYKHLKEITDFCNRHSNQPHRKFRFDPFLMLRTDHDRRRNQDILNQRLSIQEVLELEKENGDRFEALKKQCVKIQSKNISDGSPEKLFKCSAGLNSCSIDCYGIFKLCSPLIHKDCVYNLKKGSLHDAWYNFVPKIRSLNSDNQAYHKTCSNCKLRDFCMWCPAFAGIETGKLDGQVEYFCNMANKRYEFCINHV